MWEVYLESAFGVRHHLNTFNTEDEAVNFCSENDWHYVDENGFEWNLDIRKGMEVL